jgi:protein-tyrosine-phosphatase
MTDSGTTSDTPQTLASATKNILRKFIPDFLLKQRSIVLRLGPKAGQTYANLRLLDTLGIRSSSSRRVPPTARTFVFVCFGNIMRSAMSEFLMRRALQEARLEDDVRILSAGLHATPGREAHPWAQEASAEAGISLSEHRAKSLTREMVEQADCVLAMDLQNKAELLTLYPEYREKIYMLSAYAEGPWRDREIPDPYLGDLETTRFCCSQLKICVRNLINSTIANSARTVQTAIPAR